MIPMKIYFKNNFYTEFLNWYHSNSKLTKKETLSIENVSKRIVISEGICPSDCHTPQIIITANARLITIVDKFLFYEKHFVAFREKDDELRFNLRTPKEHPWL